MLRLVALIIGLAALAVSALAAAADGALVAAGPPGSGENARGLPAKIRERRHRAFGILGGIMQLLAGLALALAADLARRSAAGVLLIVVVLAAVVIILAESGPRALGASAGAAGLRRLERAGRAIDGVVGSLAELAIRADRALTRLLPPPEEHEDEREQSREPLRQTATRVAALHLDHRSIVENVFSLGDTEVQEIMMPRVDIIALDQQAPWSEVLDRVRSSEHSRLPVFDETIDHIVGVLYAKDLLPGVIQDEEPPDGWLALVRPAAFIPESKAIDVQLRDFKATGSHIAIVVDEYGGTAGLVTIEDILEEIVGDIRDEYDREAPPIEREDGKRFWVSARVSLDDLSDALEHHFERDDVSTVGGLIYNELGRVPRAGEELTIDGFRVVVERVVRRRIERVYFERSDELVEHPG